MSINKEDVEILSKEDAEEKIWRECNSIKNKTKLSVHHILNKSSVSFVDKDWNKYTFKVHDREWHIRLEEDMHMKFHNLFWNLLPHEQFVLLLLINSNAMSEYAKNVIKNIEIEDFYKKDLYIKYEK